MSQVLWRQFPFKHIRQDAHSMADRLAKETSESELLYNV